LHYVFALKVRIVGKDFINALPGADLSHDHADRDPQATDTRLATHYSGLLRNAIEVSHVVLLSAAFGGTAI